MSGPEKGHEQGVDLPPHLTSHSQRHVNVIFLLIAASTVVALLFLAAFTWAVRSGQFDDDRSPGVRILGDAKPTAPAEQPSTTNPNA
ncbi:MAG: cbb3-type cytochrome oxidase assembly protein CcoS [Flavobacteriales bacterium]